jgi:hypothetical protein
MRMTPLPSPVYLPVMTHLAGSGRRAARAESPDQHHRRGRKSVTNRLQGNL